MFIGNNVQTFTSFAHHFEGYPVGVCVGRVRGVYVGQGYCSSTALLRCVDAPVDITVEQQEMEGLENSSPGRNATIEMPSWLVTQAVAAGLVGWAEGTPPTVPISDIVARGPWPTSGIISPAVFSPYASFSKVSYEFRTGGSTLQTYRNEVSSTTNLLVGKIEGVTHFTQTVVGVTTTTTGATTVVQKYNKSTTDTQPMFEYTTEGEHKWGPGGSTALDTGLLRKAAGALKVSNAGTLLGAIQAIPELLDINTSGKTTAEITTAVQAAAGITVAADMVIADKTNKLLLVYSGTKWLKTATLTEIA